MQLAHQTQRGGQRLQAIEAVLEGGDVVAHFAQILGAALDGGAGLGREQLAESRLGSLDAAGEDGFLPNKETDEEMRIGKTASFPRKPADGPVGGGQAQGEAFVPRQRWWGWSRHKGAVAARAVHQATVGLALSVGQHTAPC